jgi:hypothetical protein
MSLAEQFKQHFDIRNAVSKQLYFQAVFRNIMENPKAAETQRRLKKDSEHRNSQKVVVLLSTLTFCQL